MSALQDSTRPDARAQPEPGRVTSVLADDPDEVGSAVTDLNAVVGDVQSFVAENRETLGTTTDKLAAIDQVLIESLDDIKQILHVAPTRSRTS